MSNTEFPPHLDPRGRHRGGSAGATGSLRPVGRVVGALLSVALLVTAGYAWYQFRDLDQNVSRLSVAVGRQGNGSAKDFDGKDQNILVVGNDDRENMSDAEVKELHVGRDGGSLATDTMMIVHVPADGSRASLISLPRDTIVDIPDPHYSEPDKLNGAYATAYVNAKGSIAEKRTAGANLLIKTIGNLTGLTVNHYVQIDLLGFYRLSKAIKGVPVTLCADVDDTAAANRARGEDGGSGLKLSKGRHVLSGVQALQFVRQRHGFKQQDLYRVKRQQYFLTSAFRQVASVGILFQLRELGDALRKSVYFDRSLNLLDLARQLENLTANKIDGRTIPTESDGSSLTADPAKVKAFVAGVVSGRTAAPSTSKAPTTAPSATTSATTGKPAIDAKCIY